MGVDVFFVISGYFLIGRQLETDAVFRPLDFLKKKSVRLLAPYFVLLVLVAVFSVFIFPANDLVKQEKLLKACLWCKGNVYLDQLSGNYFSTDTRTLPLMHLWYMGVLLQCYLLFTVLFLIWHFLRCGRKARIIHIALLGLLSFGVAYLRFTPIPWEYANDTYYWASARVWEFALGGLVYVLPKPRPQAASVSCGILALLVLLGCAWIPAQESAWMVLLGAVCGCLLLRGGMLWEKLNPLNSPLLVWLGGISFSLYLVHWPCICFAEYIMGHPFTPVPTLAAIGGLLVLAYLFYRGAEKPAYPLWTLPVLIAMAVGMQQGIHKTDGFRDQLHQEVNQLFAEPFYAEAFLSPVASDSPLQAGTEGIMPNNFTPQPYPNAVILKDIGDPGKPLSFAVIGDSLALDFANGMHIAAQQKGWHGIFLNTYTVPFWNADFPRPPETMALGNVCREDKMRRIMNWLKMHPELRTVFIAQIWDSRMGPHDTWDGKHVSENLLQARMEELREFLRQLKGLGKNAVLVTSNPTLSTQSPQHDLEAYLMWHKGEELPSGLSCARKTYEEKNGTINQEMDKIQDEGLCHVLHREKSFFDSDVFHSYDGEKLSHRDRSHLTAEGSFLGISRQLDEIDAILNQPDKE